MIAYSEPRCIPLSNHFPAMDDATSLRKGLRVLVVDSDPDSCELLELLLSDYGVVMATATCARDAIAKIQHTQPDLLISEIFLPEEDGYSLIRQVKALEMTLQIKIPAIALTACAGEYGRVDALRAGFCRHLPKPLDIDQLIATMVGLTEQA